MNGISFTNQFKKDLKLTSKRGFKITKLEEVLNIDTRNKKNCPPNTNRANENEITKAFKNVLYNPIGC